MSQKFSYAMVNDEATRKIYAQMLAEDTARVVAWRDAAPNRKQLAANKLVQVWWLVHGSTAFDTADDALQYKRELTVYAAPALLGAEVPV